MFFEFIEASAFTKYVYDYLSEDEYQVCRVIWSKLRNQAKSFLGLAESEKIRWAVSGRGKSGGVRVVYYFKKQDHEIWLLTIYSKSEVEIIPAHVLRQIAKESENV